MSKTNNDSMSPINVLICCLEADLRGAVELLDSEVPESWHKSLAEAREYLAKPDTLAGINPEAVPLVVDCLQEAAERFPITLRRCKAALEEAKVTI